MSRGTLHRTFRAEDELWLAAKAKAKAEGINLSDVLREALRRYISSAAGEMETVNPPASCQ